MSVIGVMELSFFSLCIWQEFILIGEEFVGIMVGIEELNNCFGLIAVEFDDVDGASEVFGATDSGKSALLIALVGRFVSTFSLFC
jgi:hypothetical protein